MMSIADNLGKITETIPEGVKLIAVSKTKPVEDIQAAYAWGQRIFGENKVQELAEKYELLPKDIEWHMIGHLQSNKVKYMAPFVALIHGIDSLKLLQVVDKEAGKCSRVQDCLLQFHIAEEENKFGLDEREADEMLQSEEYGVLQNIRIVGVMGVATNTEDQTQIRKEFRHLTSIFNELKKRHFPDDDGFKVLSMGMSGDYRIALEEGSTMVRIGSLIFGMRNYNIQG